MARFGVGPAGKAAVFFTLVTRSNDRCYPLTLAFARNGHRFSFTFHSHAELMLFHEVFCLEPYHLSPIKPPEAVVDLGANIGITTLYFCTEYPKARIVAVEANPHLLPRLTQALVALPHVQIISAAVSSEDGERVLHLNSDAPVGSSLIPRPENVVSISVPSMRLATLARQAGLAKIDFVKFDIEGAEWEVFSEYADRDRLAGFCGEYHEDLTGKTVQEFASLWKDLRISYKPTKKRSRFIVYGREM